jgi:hypothetical protein
MHLRSMTKSMKRNPSREADSYQGGKEIPPLSYGTRKFIATFRRVRLWFLSGDVSSPRSHIQL